MKASEVLQLYQDGKRDFQYVNLQGQSFRKANLAGADFRHADVRGTNFAQANLSGAKFTKAKAGLPKRWAISLAIFALILLAVSAFLNSFAGYVVASILSKLDIEFIIGSAVALVIFGLYFWSLFRQGINDRSSRVQKVLFAVALFVLFIAALFFALAILLAVALNLLLTVTLAVVLNVAFTVGLNLLLNVAFTVTLSLDESTSRLGIAIASIFALITLGLNLYLVYRTYQGDDNDSWVKGIGIAVAAMGGTNFSRANLTEADFSRATLKNTNFRNATLTRTNFHNVKKLDFARLGGTILTATPVRKLVVDGNGAKQDYTKVNLRGANLDDANLKAAILKYADLSEASLIGANLQAANLTEAQAVGTNFTEARLTGACLEAWNIDHTTILAEIDCFWIYLAEQGQLNSSKWGERRPSSGKFGPGEFTKLFTEVLDTVDLIFRNGVDWRAFVTAFDQVRIENEDLDLTIQSIENKGDGVIVIRVNVPQDVDKEKIHSTFNQNYQLALQAMEEKYKAILAVKDEQIAIYRETSSNMHHIAGLLASHQPNFINKTVMNENTEQSQKIDVGGDFNIDANNAVVNLRDISGKVSNTIQQLPKTTSDAPGIKELLTQLQTAIETETELTDKNKTKALKQVQKLAAAGENPQANQDDADDSLTMLKGIVSGLQETAKLVTTCQEIIPLLTGLFGLV